MKKTLIWLLIFVGIIVSVLFGYFGNNKIDSTQILSYEDCVKAGYGVMKSKPPQCKTPDGRTYTEELKILPIYKNSSADMIVVNLPFPGAVTGKEFTVVGKARGNWYFEASFPIEVLDKDGKSLWLGPAQAEGDWMTTNFVPFKVSIKVPETYIGPATLVLKKDNASGLLEHDGSISFPITIEY